MIAVATANLIADPRPIQADFHLVKLAKGSDFTPILKGLPDDLCQCPHWGYILSGSLTIRYKDGREETMRAGDLWHAPPGHTGWCDEDTEYVEFNPAKEFDHALAHVKEQLQIA